jgi:cyclopropane-fatty-acyl-phospholipid synthase
MTSLSTSDRKSSLFKTAVGSTADRVLDRALRNIIRHGALTAITSGGQVERYGDGTGTPVTIRFASEAWELAVVSDPDLRLGEAYVEGGLIVEQNSIAEFLDILVRNYSKVKPSAWTTLLASFRNLMRSAFFSNNPYRSKKNAAHHYNINFDFYELFLDRDLQYSCAYFRDQASSLDDAQLAKKELISQKLCLSKPGLKILDIGSGWGGLGLHLARHHDARVVGINLSEEQVAVARSRAAAETASCEFRIQDYSAVTGTFDRIVSVGMFEHVGKKYYDTFFRTCRDLLADDGVMLLHTVGRSNGPTATNAWVYKYIFPGGYAPALSEVTRPIERAGLIVTDVEILRLHYAETLRHWRSRILARRDEVAHLFDDRFVRMWEFYLAGFEAAFRHYGLVVFQIQMAKDISTVPLTRDYMFAPAATDITPAQG